MPSASTRTAGSVVLWDAVRHQTRATLNLPPGTPRLAFAPGGKTLAAGLGDGAIFLLDPITGQQRATLAGHADPLHALAFTRDSRTLISVSTDGLVRTWSAR